MTTSWKARERSNMRVAVIISVILHLGVLAYAASSSLTGSRHAMSHMLESIFGGAHEAAQAQLDKKV